MNWTNSQYEWIGLDGVFVMIERIVLETASRGAGPHSQATRTNGLIFVRATRDRSQGRAFGRRCRYACPRGKAETSIRARQFRCREGSIEIREKSW